MTEVDSIAELFKKVGNENEKASICSITELIRDNKVEAIQNFDVCGKVMDVIAQDAIEKLIGSKDSKEIIINIIENKKNDKAIKDLQERLKTVEEREENPIQLRRKDYLSDYITYIKSQNVMVKRAIVKDWATRKKSGREGGFNFDPDASLISSYVFCKTMPASEGEQWEIKSIGGYNYKLCVGNDNKIWFRGDTMNSWTTTLNEFMCRYGDKYLKDLVNNKGKYRPKDGSSWIDYLSEPEHYKSDLPGYINNFMEYVYTIGNFALVPREPINFNTNRSQHTKDYWDLTLLAIYEYYMGEKESKWPICSSLKEEEIEGIKKWLKQSGQQGWNKFVEGNYMQPFVEKTKDGYGRPYELWDGHFTEKALPEKEWQFEQFFENARERIRKRGRLIAEKLVDNEMKATQSKQ